MNVSTPLYGRAIALATFVNWALSVAWYSVFGATWAELNGRPPVWDFELHKVVLGVLFNGLMALGAAIVLRASGSQGAFAGARWGLVLGLLLFLPAHSGKWTWLDQPLLLAIDAGGHLVCLLASCVILSAWRPAGRSPSEQRA